MLHPGYVRSYESTLRLLLERGHDLQLLFTRPAGDKPNEPPHPDVRLSGPLSLLTSAAARTEDDRWRSVALVVRLAGDVGRYLDPRFAPAPKLRGRASDRLRSERIPPVVSSAMKPIATRVRSVSNKWAGTSIVWLSLALEHAIPVAEPAKELLRAESPDVVLVTPGVEFGSDQVEWIKAARALRIPSGVCVASWDNLTSKGLIHAEPDRLFVWNEVQRREAAELHRIVRSSVVATGAPRFDEWFERRTTRSPEELRDDVGLDPSRPHVVYVCSSSFIAGDEIPFVERWITSLRSSREPDLRDIGVIVRPHPQNPASWTDLNRDNLGNTTIWPHRGAFPADETSRADFFDSLAHAAAVVGLNTSAQIEAAIVGKSVMTVRDPGNASMTLHYRYLQRPHGGFVHEAVGLTDHREQLLAVIRGAVDDRKRLARFLGYFVRPQGIDQPATPILVDGIEALAVNRFRTMLSLR
jgi:hypothetical protein